ncbi:MAG TPA: NrfD/PsrC family molybdoenzyme membrane anchor subunit [Candidatus Limnocylindria bacterium]|nr:NrfD/PsrC family molybdoenzyme membrane anchor subunit [Candidatus Limnocylindria bacterium]
MDARTHDAYVERAMWQVGKGGLRYWGTLAVLGSLVLFGLYAYVYQLQRGLSVTGLNQKVSWGFYIINCVFFIGMSYGGAMTSAILRLTGAKWRAPLTRIAEATAVAALLVGAVYPLIDLGRPDRFLYLFLYPQVGSPVVWDLVAISTYMLASFVFLYLPLIPDVALARDTMGARAGRVRATLYRVLALGWSGTPSQERALRRGVGIMAVLIIPLAVSVHSVLAWLFAVTVRGGWHSTIFAPLFVLAAMLSGVAAVILVVAALRSAYGLQQFITAKHFRYLSYLLISLGLGYVYFMISEYLTEGYVAAETSGAVLESLFVGQYAFTFWTFAILGLLLPLVLVALPGRFPIARACTASALIVAGMWLKRFLIVVPGMADPIMPWDWGRYTPTWVELAITVGSAAAIPLLLIVFFRFFPVMSVHELDEIEGPEVTRPVLRPAFAGGGDD